MEIKTIVRQSVVAALYVALTLAVSPIAYGPIQFRISEILVLLCFFRRDYVVGLTLGCFIANFFSPMALTDVPFGTLATFISVFLISRSRNIFLASLYPVVANGLIIGLQLHFVFGHPPLFSILQVALGEFVTVSVAGVIAFLMLSRSKAFLELIEANQNI
ncbi:MAG: QueT transporter family protein [Bacilli bacterium]|nr:QueT transporter family protein [Acholeplasmataceae bacterium]